MAEEWKFLEDMTEEEFLEVVNGRQIVLRSIYCVLLMLRMNDEECVVIIIRAI